MDKNLPKNVELVTDKAQERYNIQYLAHSIGNNGVIENFSVTSPHYKTVNGIIYTANMRTVIAGNMILNDVVIPEGVEELIDGAFEDTLIKSVKMPDSLKVLGSDAFRHCLELHSVDFGNGITIIEEGAFCECRKLEHIELPSQIESIRSSAFQKTGLKNIKLNNGLKEIGLSALSTFGLDEIEIPMSLKSATAPFSRSIKHITSEKYSDVLIKAISPAWQLKPDVEHDFTIKVTIAGRTAYLPRFIDGNLQDEFLRETSAFFIDGWENRPRLVHASAARGIIKKKCYEFWSYAYLTRGKDDAALAEYLACDAAEEAKKYLKKTFQKNHPATD